MLDKEKFSEQEMLIDEVLKTEPAYTLPPDFASKVAAVAGRRVAWQQYLREFMIYLAVLLATVAVVAIMVFIWYEDNWKNWLDFLASNAALVAAINILLVFVLFSDRVLLRYFFYRTSLKRQ